MKYLWILYTQFFVKKSKYVSFSLQGHNDGRLVDVFHIDA